MRMAENISEIHFCKLQLWHVVDEVHFVGHGEEGVEAV